VARAASVASNNYYLRCHVSAKQQRSACVEKEARAHIMAAVTALPAAANA
jgi:hypothetical protein